MNIDSTTFSKIMGQSQTSSATTGLGLPTPALPSQGGQSFDELLKQVKDRPTGSLNRAHLADTSTPRLGESPADFLNRSKLLPATGGYPSLNNAPFTPASTSLPGDPSFSLNTASISAPTTSLPIPSSDEPSPEDAAARHTQIKKAAEGLISNALILPMLKQVRHSSLGENTIFSGGNGEKMFGPEFDMELSDRIAQSPRLGAKNALIARLERKPVVSRTAAADAKKTSTARIDVNA